MGFRAPLLRSMVPCAIQLTNDVCLGLSSMHRSFCRAKLVSDLFSALGNWSPKQGHFQYTGWVRGPSGFFQGCRVACCTPSGLKEHLLAEYLPANSQGKIKGISTLSLSLSPSLSVGLPVSLSVSLSLSLSHALYEQTII